ncbi:hypothetical protein THAOC_31180, partial [Thalassiosira oceanica]
GGDAGTGPSPPRSPGRAREPEGAPRGPRRVRRHEGRRLVRRGHPVRHAVPLPALRGGPPALSAVPGLPEVVRRRQVTRTDDVLRVGEAEPAGPPGLGPRPRLRRVRRGGDARPSLVLPERHKRGGAGPDSGHAQPEPDRQADDTDGPGPSLAES